MIEKALNKLSYIADGAATLCFWHCLLMPLLIGVLPIVGMSFLLHGWMEWMLMGVGVGFTFISLCWGFRTHGKYRVFALLLASVAWLAVAHKTEHPALFSGVGAGCMMVANFMNRRLCKTCDHCKEHCC